MNRADLVQILGLALIVAAAFLLWGFAVGLLCAGVAVVVVGVAEELR